MLNPIMRVATLMMLAVAALDAHAAVPLVCPTITIAPTTNLPGGTVGTSYGPEVFTASGGSATPYTYEISGGLPSASGLTIDSAGNFGGTPAQAGDFLVTITATDSNGCSGGRTDALSIAIATQTISFTSTAPGNAKVGGPTYAAAATATSGLPVTLTIDASASTVCSITGSTVSFQSVGTCVIDANQPGDANHAAAPQVQQSFSVAKGDQTITFTSTVPAGATVAGPTYTVTATATSGLPVTFAIDAAATAVCSISGSTVSFIGAGTCVIDADQAGDANWNAAAQATQSFGVGLSNQTITFTSTAPAGAKVGGPTYAVTATATSTLAVALTIDPSASAVCTIAGSTVSFIGAGNCVIDANQAGNANYNPAPQVQQTFAVGKGNQTITITSTAPAAAIVGGPTYTVTATATSGLPVAFTVDAAAATVCSIAGSTVSFQAVGNCVIDANQAGDANWNAAPQVQQTFAVAKGNQTITFTSTVPAAATVGGPAYTVTATATSGLPVTFTIDAAAASVCSIAGSTVTFQAVGNCVIDANQAGNANYNAAAQAQQTFAVGKGNQTIAFTSIAPTATVGGTSYAVTATATSGLPVTFTIDAAAAAVCSIAGSTVTFQTVGNCAIDANQPGDANWNPAPQAQQAFAVGKGTQTITFTSTVPAGATVGGPAYTVTATATSGLPVTLTIDAAATSLCSIAGSAVTFQTVGNCVIDADQAGDANWNPAPQAQQTFAVGKGNQTIAFTSTAPVGATVGAAAYTVTANATSGLPVTFTIDAAAASVCSITGSAVTFQTVGNCVIDANQAGNANYNAAPQTQQTFAVGKGNQTITFTSTAPANAQVGTGNYVVSATASSSLAVTFTIDASATSICSITGATVTFTAAGTCVIDANQAGNANYNAAPQVQQSFLVHKLDQTITFTSTSPLNAKVAGPTYTVTATASSGLTVTFSIDATSAGACTLAGAVVSFVHAGTCVIDANQAGNATYNAAPQVQQSFAIAKGDQTINVSSIAPTFGSATAAATPHTYNVTASASSGLIVAFTTTGACSVAGNTVTFGPGAGACTINANQAGNADYNAAAQVQQSVTVEIPATAVADSHAVTGNVAIQVPLGGSVLANDTGTAIFIKSFGATGTEQTTLGASTATATAGGTVTLNANGTYTYDPPPNFTGTDTFKYIVGNDLTATSTGTVTLTVSDRIIVVSTGGGGNCKPITPTPCTLALADAAAAATGNELVFVQSGSYTAPNATITLNNNQRLVGNKVSLAQAIADAGIILAADSVALATINANTTPVLTNAGNVINLASSNLVEYFVINPSAGSGIVGNGIASGTSTVHDIVITGTGAANGVNLTTNTGSTFTFSNLVISTATGSSFSATGGGTVNVTAGAIPNTLASAAGTALNVANTTIGGSGMTFLSISSGAAGNTAANGIILNTTGAGGVTVTGSGSAASGGTIQHKTGTDGSTTQGSGIFLNATQNLSLSWMQFNDFQNFAIVGTNVTGFALDHVIVNGTNGTLQGGIGEGDVYFTGLSGSATISNSQFSGAAYDTFHVFNDFNQTLNRITITNSSFAMTNASGNDALAFQATNGTLNATVQGSTISAARSDLFQLNLLGTVHSDLVFGGATAALGNTLTNSNANIVSGGGGITIGGGGPANNVTLTYNISHNSIRGSHGAVLALTKGTGTGASFTGTIDGNTIGQIGVPGSGSTQGQGISVFQDGAGTSSTTITNNHVSGVVSGMEVLVHNGAAGQMTAIVQGNTIDTLDQANSFAGIYLQTGSATGAAGDNNKACLTVGGAGALRNSTDVGANTMGALVAGIVLEQEGISRVGLLGAPNYAGTPYNFTAIQNYVSANNTFAGANALPTFAFGDPTQAAAGGYFGSCPP